MLLKNYVLAHPFLVAHFLIIMRLLGYTIIMELPDTVISQLYMKIKLLFLHRN